MNDDQGLYDDQVIEVTEDQISKIIRDESNQINRREQISQWENQHKDDPVLKFRTKELFAEMNDVGLNVTPEEVQEITEKELDNYRIEKERKDALPRMDKLSEEEFNNLPGDEMKTVIEEKEKYESGKADKELMERIQTSEEELQKMDVGQPLSADEYAKFLGLDQLKPRRRTQEEENYQPPVIESDPADGLLTSAQYAEKYHLEVN